MLRQGGGKPAEKDIFMTSGCLVNNKKRTYALKTYS